ncbi:helix-turn-helix domain-containing protein [Ruoffia tabacinasalis]|uniref:Helix-turn-helix domain-containing protein n=1 Tax=Ruoffia tabacinasalis TaxID=87458 RepID=A0ABS0LGP4_9LACT|nr:helix-turn-helix domain-containing protein [Ruoffia tabacinasalis]
MGELIKKLRKEKGMTQAEFAKAIGISRNYLSEIENNKKSASEHILQKVIEVFGLATNYFKRSGKTESMTFEIKIKEVNRIKSRVTNDMKSLDVYKKEFDMLIEVYADLIYHYQRMMELYEELGYPIEDDFGKKPVLVTQLEALRKDIITYSDRLMVNPRSYQSLTDIKEPPKSKLAEALKMIG